MHFIVVLILNENVRPSLEYFIPEHEDQLLISLDAEVSEVLNIEQHPLLPAPEPVLILNEILLHRILHIREYRDDLVEGFLGDVADITVARGLDRGSSPVIRGD